MAVGCRFVDGVVCCEQITTTNGYCEEHFLQTSGRNEMEITENRMEKKQPLKLTSSLKRIATLELGDEKKAIMEKSKFYKLSKVSNPKESSATLLLMLCQLYDAEQKKFILNSETSFSFCAHEAANALSIPNTGIDFTKPLPKDSDSFPCFLSELRKKFKGNKEGRITASDIKIILRQMPVDTEEDELRFRQLMCYYIIEQVLLCGGNTKVPRCSYWSIVSDLDKFESINCAKATFEHLHDSINEVKLKFKNANASQHSFKGAAPVLEAIIYRRIPSLCPQKSFQDHSPLLQKYGPQRNDMKKWNWADLTSDKITNCDYCSRGSTPVEGSSTPVIYVSHGFLAENEVPNTFMGLSLEEDEAEDEVPIMDATAEASAAQQHDVRRRSKREKKPVSKLINEISGKGKPKKPKEKSYQTLTC